ncbi:MULTISPECIES: hypothetical protein [unclassified Tolypothrix]|uniref:hypothetical protein n=1 Tax=unclassified Tolypothrix TaxID=2649714 RepID=UPI0005EAC560|nr:MULTISPECIES: hypothetical protein [unclassified Tolypothrix]BAY95457.1 hypothetical protein NIES3275_75140 [Microchaete diplosiphon NIES-3275]EKF00703.1 hypothetical protein FDUTEX481_08852 [Tolypothrix sp. PCC 7601]MBE9084595.1 hypothetical protein [Tolypothrix sp. LEGE 11397]UYD28638.1 hypothetical protein HGR01_11750 [Tolypothrix sp. PCC 7712]UYD35449.1 hypothetical protein HG267_06615 [Tolypothrix sp. PCC 7601]
MTKYLVELKHSTSGDMKLVQLEQDTLEDAHSHALEANPGYEVVKVKHTHGGKRNGAGRTSKWGDGVKTKNCRVPITFGDNAEEIVSELEMINHILDSWQSKVDESKAKSASGQPSERYKYVAQLVADLKQAMKVTGEKLV